MVGSKAQLLQQFKLFSNTKLVNAFLDVLQKGFQHLHLTATAEQLLCTIPANQQQLLVEYQQYPILSIHIQNKQKQLALILKESDCSQFSYIKTTKPLPQSSKKAPLCQAFFVPSKELLQQPNLIEAWLTALSSIPISKRKPNKKHHNTWLYRTAMDEQVRAEFLAALHHPEKYRPLLPKALEQSLNQPEIKAIQQAPYFYFEAASGLLENFQQIQLVDEVYEEFLSDYQASNQRYDHFVYAAQGQKAYATFGLLLGQLISHIEYKATGKQAWNKYKDKRTLARTGIRQHIWIQQLTAYKLAGNTLNAIRNKSIQQALLYLQQPQAEHPILSIRHQQQIANHLLESSYQANHFALQLISYFNRFELKVSNFSNYTYFLQQLLYSDTIRPLWQYHEYDSYEQNLVLPELAEPLPTYGNLPQVPLNQVLFGPPGTGKTFKGIQKALTLLGGLPKTQLETWSEAALQEQLQQYVAAKQLVFTTFHQAMSYEDFIEGIKPVVVNDQVQYVVQKGILLQLAQAALQQPKQPFVCFIDELNRGNVAQIFGELITLLEPDKRLGATQALQVQLPYSKQLFGLPPNVYFIATMNSSDRNVEQLDAALRRRFVFQELLPDPLLLSENLEEINLRKLLNTINERISILLDRNHLIGHAYFMKVQHLDALQQVFRTQLIPLLLEYFYGDVGKIGLVLGKAFVNSRPMGFQTFADFDYEGMDRNWDKPIYQLNSFPLPKSAYIAIYQDH